ncbi:pilus assembly protein TadG-related protein [Streptomyces aidingensis]|uniref:Putative Flp pilus-assembly TadE/G-like n=1 Tax=Streptomyces aidingensis TaxID=910347 RepID=A0A1I1F5A3_9ACTN|nr:pilus assembly protein TadG-related protein [Streptomyces aidingensis]SFB94467.1 Putative Flp pilus-assembly TadE/G-like [Streptomyces aidingensis]
MTRTVVPPAVRAVRGVRAVRAGGRDRGSGAILVVLFAVVVLLLAAFVVDGGLSIASRERAADIAEQAARYAAQDINEDALRSGDGSVAPINFENCDANVAEFVAGIELTSAEIDGHDCREGAAANEVEVTIDVTYRPVFGGLLFQTLTVTGTATAEARTG